MLLEFGTKRFLLCEHRTVFVPIRCQSFGFFWTQIKTTKLFIGAINCREIWKINATKFRNASSFRNSQILNKSHLGTVLRCYLKLALCCLAVVPEMVVRWNEAKTETVEEKMAYPDTGNLHTGSLMLVKVVNRLLHRFWFFSPYIQQTIQTVQSAPVLLKFLCICKPYRRHVLCIFHKSFGFRVEFFCDTSFTYSKHLSGLNIPKCLK